MSIQFGDFNEICNIVSLPLCPLLTLKSQIGPTCYARSVDFTNWVLFEPASLAMYIISLIMTVFMVVHIRTKYTAIGRKEFLLFFYIYMLELVFNFLVTSGIFKTGSEYLAAVHTALVTSTLFCLLANGFVGFQFVEDGSFFSVWSVRLISFISLALSFLIAFGTFKNGLLSKSTPVVLWILLYIIHTFAVFIYSVMQIILVIRTADDYWPIGNIVLGLAFIVVGQVLSNVLSSTICEALSHYVDGLFFSDLCTLLAVMMIYKYWDSMSNDDLEFTVNVTNNWEVKDMVHEDTPYIEPNPYSSPTYGRSSHYDRISKNY